MEHIRKLNEVAKTLEKLEVKYSQLQWTEYTVGFDFGTEEAYEKILDVYKDKKNYDIICECMTKDLDFKDRRRVEIIHNRFKPYHLSEELNEIETAIQKKTNELSRVLNTHRNTIDGREISSVELAQILSSDDNRERRKTAYFARAQVNKPLVDAGFVDLINMRKEYARVYGAEDFVALKLEEGELNPSLFNNWTKELHEMLPKMNERRSEYAKKYLGDDQIMPWDETYIDSKIAPLLNAKVDMSNYYNNIHGFFKNFGIDISKFNITYDVFSRANKSEWGYNFPVQTGKDSRILANVKDEYSEYEVLLHETGHGVHSFLLDADETILNNGVSGIIEEGLANLFGGFIYEDIFYKKFFDNCSEVEKQFSEIKQYRKLTSLRAINSIFFDQALYRNNVKSLDDIYELYGRVSSDVLKERPFSHEVPWGYRIHHTTHPIYLHNYFIGDVTCEMLSKVFTKKQGVQSIIDKPKEFGDFITNEVIKKSGLYKYQELFKNISGEAFSLKYLID